MESVGRGFWGVLALVGLVSAATPGYAIRKGVPYIDGGVNPPVLKPGEDRGTVFLKTFQPQSPAVFYLIGGAKVGDVTKKEQGAKATVVGTGNVFECKNNRGVKVGLTAKHLLSRTNLKYTANFHSNAEAILADVEKALKNPKIARPVLLSAGIDLASAKFNKDADLVVFKFVVPKQSVVTGTYLKDMRGFDQGVFAPKDPPLGAAGTSSGYGAAGSVPDPADAKKKIDGPVGTKRHFPVKTNTVFQGIVPAPNLTYVGPDGKPFVASSGATLDWVPMKPGDPLQCNGDSGSLVFANSLAVGLVSRANDGAKTCDDFTRSYAVSLATHQAWIVKEMNALCADVKKAEVTLVTDTQVTMETPPIFPEPESGPVGPIVIESKTLELGASPFPEPAATATLVDSISSVAPAAENEETGAPVDTNVVLSCRSATFPEEEKLVSLDPSGELESCEAGTNSLICPETDLDELISSEDCTLLGD